MKYIQKAALAAALLLLLPAAYPAHGASDTLEAAEKAVEKGKISDKDMDILLDQVKYGWQSGGKDSHFDWKAMGDVVLGEILKSDVRPKIKSCKRFWTS